MKEIPLFIALLLLARMVSAQGFIISHKTKEPTRGSRYFFKHFVRGFIINENGELVKKPGSIYDYDKVSGQLLLKPLNSPVLTVKTTDVQSFTLYDNGQNAFVFERVPAIDSQKFVQVLSFGLKYKIYKLLETHFVSANYRDDGIDKEGNKYDEFVDEGSYYVLNVESGRVQKFSPKIRSLKEAFSNDDDKLNKFIALHPSDTVGDVYLSNLGEFMNN